MCIRDRLENCPITLRRGDGLESLTFRLTLSLFKFSLRPRCGLESLTLRLESLPLLYLRCLAQHITYQVIYINERVS